mmetsp:Transcript_5853/g.21183  ORF Transcript_5853/g.21183 Transcript_5853/m.21183 type:complete len:329 (+) Transcript_5853:121-1107(+)
MSGGSSCEGASNNSPHGALPTPPNLPPITRSRAGMSSVSSSSLLTSNASTRLRASAKYSASFGFGGAPASTTPPVKYLVTAGAAASMSMSSRMRASRLVSTPMRMNCLSRVTTTMAADAADVDASSARLPGGNSTALGAPSAHAYAPAGAASPPTKRTMKHFFFLPLESSSFESWSSSSYANVAASVGSVGCAFKSTHGIANTRHGCSVCKFQITNCFPSHAANKGSPATNATDFIADAGSPNAEDFGAANVASLALLAGSHNTISLAAEATMEPSALNAPAVMASPLGCAALERQRHPACSPPRATRPLGTQILNSPSEPPVNAMAS